MAAKKHLKSGERAALLLTASGSCYNPDCSEQLTVVRDGNQAVNFEIAHIRDEIRPNDPDADIG